jgi:hypothetical protein
MHEIDTKHIVARDLLLEAVHHDADAITVRVGQHAHTRTVHRQDADDGIDGQEHDVVPSPPSADGWIDGNRRARLDQGLCVAGAVR